MMKKGKLPLPPKYWVYLFAFGVLAVLLFVNIFATDGLTGEKEFWDFSQQVWCYFVLFLLTEIVIALFMFLFGVKAGKLSANRQEQIEHYFEGFRYIGIKPGDYDYVWFDFSGTGRAKIAKLNDVFYLYVEAFDRKTETWNAVNTVSVSDSLEDVRKTLFYEFDFFCEANAAIDEHGNEVFKESRL